MIRNEPSSRLATARRETAVLAGYALLTACMTYPLVGRFTTAVPGDDTDVWLHYWNLWWFKRAVLDLGTNPFFTAEIHHPQGASLLFHTLSPLTGLLALPFVAAFGLTVAYNAMVVFGFVAGGYGGYRLLLHVLRDASPADGRTTLRLAAFLGGSVFTFSTYHFMHLLGHLEVASLQWLPFYVLFLSKSWQEPGARNPLLAAAFLAMTGFTAFYHWLYLVVFSALFAGYHFLADRRDRWRALARFGVATVFGNLLLAPLLLPMAWSLHERGRLVEPEQQILDFSADLLAAFVPSTMHPIWGDSVRALQHRLMGSGNLTEAATYLGYTALALGAIGGAARNRRFWLFALASFWILSLGPLLHVGGRLALVFGEPIPLPFLAISALPIMETMRATSRFIVVATLALAVLAGVGAHRLLGRLREPRMRVVVFATLLGAVLLENAAVPYPTVAVTVPAVFSRIRDDPRRVAVLEVPIADDPAIFPRRMLYQTVHQKPSYGGYVSRGLPTFPFDRLPGFAPLKRLSDASDVASPDMIDGNPLLSHRAALIRYETGYVVLDKLRLSRGELARAEHVAEQTLGAAARFDEDAELVVYVVPPAAELPHAVLAVDQGWYPLEHAPPEAPVGAPPRWRWMSTEAGFTVVTPRQTTGALVFRALSFKVPRPIAVFADGRPVGSFDVTPERREVRTRELSLGAGAHAITLVSVTGTRRNDLPDDRPLSIEVSGARFDEGTSR